MLLALEAPADCFCRGFIFRRVFRHMRRDLAGQSARRSTAWPFPFRAILKKGFDRGAARA